MKSLLKWTGGKTSELPIIRQNLPKFDRYVEPFLGGGSVFFDQERISLVNDFNAELIAFYAMNDKDFDFFYQSLEKIDYQRKRALSSSLNAHNFLEFIKSEYSELYSFAEVEHKRKILMLNKHKIDQSDCKIWQSAFCASQYYWCRDQYNKRENSISHICMWFVMRELSYSGMFRFSSSGNFNVPYGGQSYDNKDLLKKICYFKQLRSLDFYRKTEFNNLDFEDFFNYYNFFKEDDFIFLDPPYDSAFSQYNVEEDFNRTHQKRLRDCLKNTKAKFMLVVKNTDMMQDLYQGHGFHLSLFDKNYMVNFKNRNEKSVKHLMVKNYSL